MNMNIPHNIGIASQIGKYSDAIETGPHTRWLISAGKPGLNVDGTLPTDITGQAELAWANIFRILEAADMGIKDVLKITHYLTRQSDIPEYVKVRSRLIGDARPASMLMVIPALVRPEFLVEIEIIAAKN
jgi:enamine deaminase RidA (YjgF/YER057c/UK114 family)